MGFEWQSEKDIESKGITVIGSAQGFYEADQCLVGFADIGIQWEPASVAAFLQKNGIQTDSYGKGKAKTLGVLTKELLRGESSFRIDTSTNELVRYVEIVWTKIRGPTGKLLVEINRVYPEGKKRTVERMPGGKRRPFESVLCAARRILAKELTLPEEMFKLDADASAGIELDVDSVTQDIRESPSYPGLKSYYRIHTVEATIDPSGGDADLLAEFGLPGEESFSTYEVTGDKHMWQWVTDERAEELGALSFDGDRGPSKFDILAPATDSMWTDAALLNHWMNLYEIDTSQGLEQLQNDLTCGNLVLLENSSINSILAVKDIVSLRAKQNDSKVLIDVGANKLPSRPRGSGSLKEGAQRLVEQLSAQNHVVSTNLKIARELIVHEETYPNVKGLKVVVREHIVECC